MNEKLTKNVILNGKYQISEVFSKGKLIKSSYVNILYLDSNNFKICFAVSKSVRGAVRKNRLKRLLREIYRTNKIYFPENKWIIIIGKKIPEKLQTLQIALTESIQQLK
jgi:ribonuclease P protein component